LAIVQPKNNRECYINLMEFFKVLIISTGFILIVSGSALFCILAAQT